MPPRSDSIERVANDVNDLIESSPVVSESPLVGTDDSRESWEMSLSEDEIESANNASEIGSESESQSKSDGGLTFTKNSSL